MKNYNQLLTNTLHLVLIFLLLSFAGCNKSQQNSLVIKIIETSDVHAAVFPYDFIENRNKETSLSNIYQYVTEEREKNENVILLDNGDILQGQPSVYYSNINIENQEHICSKMMNYMQYDAATIGNHDIEAGHIVYDKLIRDFNFPWMAANAIDTKTNKPYFKPYTILKKDGAKIAVLGLITPGIPGWLPETLWKGIAFGDMVESAEKWITKIKKDENPDIIVGLLHAGFDYTYANQNADTYKNENASVLVAKRVKGFDVIFIGHDHKSWNEKIVNNYGDTVLLLGPQNSAKEVAVVNVNVKTNSKNIVEYKFHGKIVDISNYKESDDFNKEFKEDFLKTKEYVNKPITYLSDTIFSRKALFGPSKFVDLIHQVQLDKSKAQISFTAPLSFNTSLNKGTIYVSDMFKLYKFENFLYTMKLNGNEILKYLEYSYNLWFNKMKSEDDNLLKFKKDKNGNIVFSEKYQSYQLASNYFNFDAAAGIKYTVDVSKPYGERVKIISLSNGDNFNRDTKYRVAINSYRGNGGGGHLVYGAEIPKHQLSNRIISSTKRDLRYYIIQYLEKNDTICPKIISNWEVIPYKWWIKGKQKDEELLFE
ncbi:MAG: 5'-nucleotidase C-terminal domain-containing protein [Bacteroidales bacterium]|jgi:2',3'-cyclic-nucleotide 2'-phosphodiesterase/3'-nucleotidase|nr:5'-nucleotidase C-terminal domain-containing protein [Bacteroidales bacterium]